MTTQDLTPTHHKTLELIGILYELAQRANGIDSLAPQTGTYGHIVDALRASMTAYLRDTTDLRYDRARQLADDIYAAVILNAGENPIPTLKQVSGELTTGLVSR